MSSSPVVVAWSMSCYAAAAAQKAAALAYDSSMRDFVAVSLWVSLLLNELGLLVRSFVLILMRVLG